ncbi:MAG: hypothetical protein IJ449_12960 [Clostridia bacterium]|nr:hypothetical protein [Clostridia bacterium]
MKAKYTVSGALALLLLTSALAACGNDSTQSTDTTASVGGDTTASVTETPEDTRESHKVPVDSLDFGGEELNLVGFDWQGYKFYFFAEEENGDVMNDALYNRNRVVEDALNVRIVNEIYGENCNDYITALKPIILAGDDVYDMMFNHCIAGISTYASEGYLYNLDNLPYIDMEAEWWNREQMDVLRLGENTYYAVNDMMIPCPYVIFFNKAMVERLDMENPYKLVYEGTWTLDKFEEMARLAVDDVNGDGKMDENDSWGVSANEVSKYISFMTGAGQYITETDADGYVQLALNTEKTQSLMERFEEMTKDDVIYIPPTMERADMLTIDTDRLMFQLDAISDAELLRDYTVDFGFLPYPKYDESQKDYISLDWGGLLSVPCTISNPELVGAAMELFAWESANEVIPTYYDTVLTGKLARDDDAVKMMDILFDTVAYEIGGNYFGFSAGFGDLFYSLPRLAIEKESSDFASFYNKNLKAAQKTIDSFYENLENTESVN